jgi:signal transduction histidine kinase
MHGTITLDDTPGGGLMATIELPVAEPSPAATEPSLRTQVMS